MKKKWKEKVENCMNNVKLNEKCALKLLKFVFQFVVKNFFLFPDLFSQQVCGLSIATIIADSDTEMNKGI